MRRAGRKPGQISNRRGIGMKKAIIKVMGLVALFIIAVAADLTANTGVLSLIWGTTTELAGRIITLAQTPITVPAWEMLFIIIGPVLLILGIRKALDIFMSDDSPQIALPTEVKVYGATIRVVWANSNSYVSGYRLEPWCENCDLPLRFISHSDADKPVSVSYTGLYPAWRCIDCHRGYNDLAEYWDNSVPILAEREIRRAIRQNQATKE